MTLYGVDTRSCLFRFMRASVFTFRSWLYMYIHTYIHVRHVRAPFHPQEHTSAPYPYAELHLTRGPEQITVADRNKRPFVVEPGGPRWCAPTAATTMYAVFPRHFPIAATEGADTGRSFLARRVRCANSFDEELTSAPLHVISVVTGEASSIAAVVCYRTSEGRLCRLKGSNLKYGGPASELP